MVMAAGRVRFPAGQTGGNMSDEMIQFGKNLRDFLGGFGGARGPGGLGGGDGPTPTQFPPGGIDFIKHDLRVQITAEKRNPFKIVDMTGAMIIQRSDPYLGKDGKRAIDFKVLSWAATGWIEELGMALTYVLSANVDQPTSTIVAEQDRFDYPASFNFNVIFDARLNNATAFERLHGRPEGHGFMQVPPTGDRRLSPTITRFTDVGVVTMRHPELGEVVVKPVDCNDRQGETLKELPGVRLIGPLTPPRARRRR
jgi:hypothetical protein